jgi:hypothetical protein
VGAWIEMLGEMVQAAQAQAETVHGHANDQLQAPQSRPQENAKTAVTVQV